MNFEKAVGIIAEIAPELLVDPFNANHPKMVVLRRAEGASPFSIHVTTAAPDPEKSQNALDAEERDALVAAVASAKQLLPPLAS